MDFRILLYFSMMFYAVQCSSNLGNNMPELKRLIADSKKRAQEISTDVDRFSMKLQFTRNSELGIPELTNKRMLYSVLQAADSQFNINVKEALKNGKNQMKVTNCQRQAKTALTSIEVSKENAFKKCQDDAAVKTAAAMHPLQEIFQRGNHLAGQLDSVLARCDNANTFLAQTSVSSRFRDINNSVTTLAAAAVKRKEEVKSTFNNAFATLRKCNANIVDAAKLQCDKVKHGLNVCLQRA